MTRASYDVSLVQNVVCVEDLDEGTSVTNDADGVVADLGRRGLLSDHNGQPRRVIYRDTNGLWDELQIVEGRFAGFGPIGKTDRAAALEALHDTPAFFPKTRATIRRAMADALLPGTKFMWRGDEARVMAVADGYVMARKPGAMPFVASVRDVFAALAQASD